MYNLDTQSRLTTERSRQAAKEYNEMSLLTSIASLFCALISYSMFMSQLLRQLKKIIQKYNYTVNIGKIHCYGIIFECSDIVTFVSHANHYFVPQLCYYFYHISKNVLGNILLKPAHLLFTKIVFYIRW